MFSISDLKGGLSEESNWVVVDPDGVPLEFEVPADLGPATLLTGPVTDALKRVDHRGRVEASVDREEIYAVVGFALHRVVLDRLNDSDVDTLGLIELVEATEIGWQYKPISEMIRS